MRVLKALIRRIFTIKKVVHLDITYAVPSNRFAGKRVLVTGGTSGIGFACAKAFISEGAKVLICARKANHLDAALRELQSDSAMSMVLDVANVGEIKGRIDTATEKLGGKIDVFVNCAGVSAYNGGIMDEKMYDYICDVNTRGLYFMNQYEGDYMIKNGIHGKIVNITSKAGERIGFDPYTLSKWGANAITRGNARRLAPHHINVNGVAPGRVPTHITAELEQHINTGNAFTPNHATQRFTMPDEVASMVLYLSSGVANNIVGQIIVMDGGSYN